MLLPCSYDYHVVVYYDVVVEHDIDVVFVTLHDALPCGWLQRDLRPDPTPWRLFCWLLERWNRCLTLPD